MTHAAPTARPGFTAYACKCVDMYSAMAENCMASYKSMTGEDLDTMLAWYVATQLGVREITELCSFVTTSNVADAYSGAHIGTLRYAMLYSDILHIVKLL